MHSHNPVIHIYREVIALCNMPTRIPKAIVFFQKKKLHTTKYKVAMEISVQTASARTNRNTIYKFLIYYCTYIYTYVHKSDIYLKYPC